MRHRTAYLCRWLVLAQPLIDHWRNRLSSVQVRDFTSATSSGRTQCTRLRTKGGRHRMCLDLSYKQYRPQSSTLLTHCGVAPECGHGPDHVELCPEGPRAGLMLRLARLISDQSRLWRRGGLIWARVGDRGMPSRYTDALAVMQRRGSIRRHLVTDEISR
jgi:hypothetical protein